MNPRNSVIQGREKLLKKIARLERKVAQSESVQLALGAAVERARLAARRAAEAEARAAKAAERARRTAERADRVEGAREELARCLANLDKTNESAIKLGIVPLGYWFPSATRAWPWHEGNVSPEESGT